MQFVLTEYIDGAMQQAVYKRLKDRSYFGKIQVCPGVIAIGSNIKACEQELRSALEDWILLGLKMRHRLPVIRRIDLNRRSNRERLEAV